MNRRSDYLKQILKNIKNLREKQGVSTSKLEESLILGPGWIEHFESGKTMLPLDAFLAVINSTNSNASDIFNKTTVKNDQLFPRSIYAMQNGEGIDIHFEYAKHDALFYLAAANVEQFNSVILELRNGLSKLAQGSSASEALKTDAVAKSFIKAVTLWPEANPSDLWWFIIYRAFCDPFNHPAIFSRLSFEQSWKRTGGWALEEIFVRHYSPALKKNGVNMFIAPANKRVELIKQAGIEDRLEADKADIFLTGKHGEDEIFFGIVHVKASFAERRTDDVPMSKALVDAGYVSPLLTMDCKSSPSARPFNKGELGALLGESADRRSAKRKDIEDDGFFSACFSYNQNTSPTPKDQAAKSFIYVNDFNSPDGDSFFKFVIAEWKNFRQRKLGV
ncbi:BsaWI family type II restriction enzyme [Desulfuromonas thiophila]|uniref:BsaWI family type II restriction enzyme n=1 Tax=Desulfuromonas thiophila TaxID=57664 RepID=UPI0024A7B883|nr:BsaWI family type II restriction enzyme [Desulfuromonas thiophila]